MNSDIVSLENLINYVKNEDPTGNALVGNSQSGRDLGRRTKEITKDIATDRGFYLWGSYDKRGFWENIYLGKAGFSKHSGLYKRIKEELRDERGFLWYTVLGKKGVLDKGAEIKQDTWSKCKNEWNRHLLKAGTSHIVWVATPDITESDVLSIEADLIETLNPKANVIRTTPPSKLQEVTKEIISQFRFRIHKNRPNGS